ncbi:MAG: hypothetical protein LBM13_04740, partial [Candidatus Ancillula sp.]|nr:hypothetical protein [Candidatus Ancillula sp.]
PPALQKGLKFYVRVISTALFSSKLVTNFQIILKLNLSLFVVICLVPILGGVPEGRGGYSHSKFDLESSIFQYKTLIK